LLPVGTEADLDIGDDAGPRKETRFLEHDAGDARIVDAPGSVRKRECSGARQFQSEQETKQRALAAAATSDDGDELAGLHIEIDAIEDAVVAERFA
jgi:hypothetical protein